MSRALALLALLFAGVAFATPPIALTVRAPYTLTFSWQPATHYASGAVLPGLPWYKLYAMDPVTLYPNLIYWIPKGSTSFQWVVSRPGTYCYAISDEIYDGTPNGNESAKSGPICVLAQ
jgi:hypothetical protein